jgi:hypothetical protein
MLFTNLFFRFFCSLVPLFCPRFSYLSDMLTCDPMRITKKFAGASCIGKQVFTPCGETSPAEQEKLNRELNVLKDAFINRLHNTHTLHNRHLFLSRGTERTVATAVANVAERSVASSSGSKPTSARDSVSNNSCGYDDEGGSSSSYTVAKHERSAEKKDSRGSGKQKTPKRVVSTPNLQAPIKQHLSPIAGSVPIDPTLAAQQLKLKRILKRAHSSLTITECDNLVTDHAAASDLFMQFVSKITHEVNEAVTTAEERRRNMSPSLRPPLPEHSLKVEAPGVSSVSDENQPTPEGKMSMEFPLAIKVESESDDALTDMGSPNGTCAYIASNSSSSGSPVGLEMDCDEDPEDGGPESPRGVKDVDGDGNYSTSSGSLDSDGMKGLKTPVYTQHPVAYVE